MSEEALDAYKKQRFARRPEGYFADVPENARVVYEGVDTMKRVAMGEGGGVERRK